MYLLTSGRTSVAKSCDRGDVVDDCVLYGLCICPTNMLDFPLRCMIGIVLNYCGFCARGGWICIVGQFMIISYFGLHSWVRNVRWGMESQGRT